MAGLGGPGEGRPYCARKLGWNLGGSFRRSQGVSWTRAEEGS